MAMVHALNWWRWCEKQEGTDLGENDLCSILWGPSRIFLARPSARAHTRTRTRTLTALIRVVLAVVSTGYPKIMAITTKYLCDELVFGEMASSQRAFCEPLGSCNLDLATSTTFFENLQYVFYIPFPHLPAKGNEPQFPQALTWRFMFLILQWKAF